MAEWNFDERSSIDGKGDIARDSSGHGHDAQLHGPVWVKHGNGFVIKLDGFDDYVDCGTSDHIGIGGAVTLEAWFKSTRKAHGEAVLLGEEYSSYAVTYYNGERVYWYIRGGGNNIRGKLSLNQWYHVAVAFDGNQMRLWVNGRHVASKESRIKSYQPTGNFRIGVKGSPTSPKFKGMVDRVRIYNRAISDDEVLAHFESEKSEYLDLKWAGRVKFTPYYYTDRKEVVVEADYKGLQPLNGRGRLQFTLSPKRKPDDVLQSHLVDPVPARAGLAEATMSFNDLAHGEYLVRVSMEDDDRTYPLEEFAFSCPMMPRPLLAPAQKVALALPANQSPTPFKFQMGRGGGFTITSKDSKFPFNSRISWPNGDYNHLSAGGDASPRREKNWKVRVTSDKDSYQFVAGGDFYTIHREIEVFPTHVYVKDRYTNITDEDIGLLIYNETRGRQQEGSTDYCPSGFFTDANTGMGMCPLMMSTSFKPHLMPIGRGQRVSAPKSSLYLPTHPILWSGRCIRRGRVITTISSIPFARSKTGSAPSTEPSDIPRIAHAAAAWSSIEIFSINVG